MNACSNPSSRILSSRSFFLNQWRHTQQQHQQQRQRFHHFQNPGGSNWALVAAAVVGSASLLFSQSSSSLSSFLDYDDNLNGEENDRQKQQQQIWDTVVSYVQKSTYRRKITTITASKERHKVDTVAAAIVKLRSNSDTNAKISSGRNSDPTNRLVSSYWTPWFAQSDSCYSRFTFPSTLLPSPQTTHCFFNLTESSRESLPKLPSERSLQRSKTISDQLIRQAETKETLDSKYRVNWRRPLGEGAFGAVYAGTHKQTGQRVAIKKISKRFTNSIAFQNEMGALLHIRAQGGHPNICGLQENFEEHDADDETSGHFYLVLDLIVGGEMFDQLCIQGAYSEADAARLIREVASAMNFIHGIGIVHGDMKPENLMLSTKESASAVVKVVDFGCAQILADYDDPWGSYSSDKDPKNDASGLDKNTPLRGPSTTTANTPAYSAPEVLKVKRGDRGRYPIDPSFDMWAVGVILYIMLTGVHPFDLYGNSTDAEIEDAIVSGKRPPLRDAPLTSHLSSDAISVIEQLLHWDPKRRLTAQQLLEHPWVRGETARQDKIAGSDKRLGAYRSFKTKLQAKVFANMVSQSADAVHHNTSKPKDFSESSAVQRTSLIERAFQNFDRDNKGFIPAKELQKLMDEGDTAVVEDGLSLSGFTDILADNMQNKYFPKGTIIYKEGEIGNAMFFLNSGSIEVYTKDGYKSVRHAGEFFGEGALLNPKKIRSASIRCLTPVHAIEISREYFEKYLESEEGLMINIREHDRARKRQRAKTLLRLQRNVSEKSFGKGDYLFKVGEQGTELFVLDEGKVVLQIGGQDIIEVGHGEMTGEHSTVFGRPRNVDAVCLSEEGCKVLVMQSRDFSRLLKSNPGFKETVREICLRREFQKALCHKTQRPFPKDEKGLRQLFEFVDTGRTNTIRLDEIRHILLDFDPTYKEQDIKDILASLDLEKKGEVGWLEFRRIFGMDEKDKGGGEGTASSGTRTRDLRRKKWKRGG